MNCSLQIYFIVCKQMTSGSFKNIITNYSFINHIGYICGGARGVMVIVVGNGHGDTSSNPGRD